ncbi:hypothetical protein QBC40DRAFT_291692 [Triangularia verruculosa]|uniref:Uncharacterized protein n=1 Tax=Triangularia verruculosa TaxID=2587418 RepID=A0AAN6XS99_9PEZI|nr:hypothetical protein QBC40DRAFT_291692 [Triangularia verruculosa]
MSWSLTQLVPAVWLLPMFAGIIERRHPREKVNQQARQQLAKLDRRPTQTLMKMVICDADIILLDKLNTAILLPFVRDQLENPSIATGRFLPELHSTNRPCLGESCLPVATGKETAVEHVVGFRVLRHSVARTDIATRDEEGEQ